jgi:parallel beta-helix repeat protein
VWFHENVTEGNSRFGIRYENSPKPDLNPNDPVKALIERNITYGNAEGGIAVADAANATVQNNTFAQSLGGQVVHNGRNLAVVLRNSGQASRGTQKNARVLGNTLNGEGITDCGLRGNVCTNNN